MKMHSLLFLSCGLAALSAMPVLAQSAPVPAAPRRARVNLEQFQKIAAELRANGQGELADQMLKAARDLAARGTFVAAPGLPVPPAASTQPVPRAAPVAGLPGFTSASAPVVRQNPPPNANPFTMIQSGTGAGGGTAEQRHYHEHHHYYHDAPAAGGAGVGVTVPRAAAPARAFQRMSLGGVVREAVPPAPTAPSAAPLGVRRVLTTSPPTSTPGPSGPSRRVAPPAAVPVPPDAPAVPGPRAGGRRVLGLTTAPAPTAGPAAPDAPAAPTAPAVAGPRPPARRALALPGAGNNLDAEVDGLRKEVTELRQLLDQLRKTLQARSKSNN